MPNTVQIVGAGLLVLLCAGGSRSAQEWTIASPPPGTVALPAIALPEAPMDADRVKVCIQAGIPPRTYPLISSRSCRANAPTCTVFVAVPAHDTIRLQEYDLGNPPLVVATDDVCTQPSRPMTGVLGRTLPER